MVAPIKDKDRRKSGGNSNGKPSLVTTLKVASKSLRKIVDPASLKEETPTKESPATSNTLPAESTAPVSNGEPAPESAPGTPAPAGTPSQTSMGPPGDASKKKGVKRSAPGANGLEAKIRGKPGPKKRAKV
jgi:hypothetical protein